MNDLNFKFKASKLKESVELYKMASKLGWSTVAWNTCTFGKVGATTTKPTQNVDLESSGALECTRLRKLVCNDSVSQPTQLNRITVTIDEVVDGQTLTAGNEQLKSFDIVAACPGNSAVFAYLCKTAQIDLISIDFSRKVPFPLIKKQLDQAVERGVFFEIVYSPLLQTPQSRREVLAGTRVLIQFLRGRNIILSSGAETAADIRGVFDVLNMGQLLNLSQEQAKLAISKNCEALLKHAKARRLKFIPLEVLPADAVQKRWAFKRQNPFIMGTAANHATSFSKRNRHDASAETSSDTVVNDSAAQRCKLAPSSPPAARAAIKPSVAQDSGEEEVPGGEESGGDGNASKLLLF